jgi:hypothetical protein
MAAVTDSPHKAIEYVTMFLPGFIALGLTIYITDVVLSDFTFAYIAIALSLIVYVVANGIMRGLTRCSRLRAHVTSLGVIHLGVAAIVSLALASALTLLYESQWMIRLLRAVSPSTILKVSQRAPLIGILAADATKTLYRDIDDRPIDFRLAMKPAVNVDGKAIVDGDGKQVMVIAQYNLYLRVHLEKDRIYEGRVRRFEMEKGHEGFPIVLSPACRITIQGSDGQESVGRIFGPGVFITGKDLKAMELLEEQASACWRCFNSMQSTAQRNYCYDVLPQ